MTKVEIVEHLKKELPGELHGVEEYMQLAENSWNVGDHISAEMLMQIAGDEHDHAKFIIHQIEHNGGMVEDAVKEKFQALEHQIMEHYN